MNTYFLKFPDEDSAHGALTAAGLYQPPQRSLRPADNARRVIGCGRCCQLHLHQ
jgi:hypothetical protein